MRSHLQRTGGRGSCLTIYPSLTPEIYDRYTRAVQKVSEGAVVRVSLIVSDLTYQVDLRVESDHQAPPVNCYCISPLRSIQVIFNLRYNLVMIWEVTT